jgi:hypothetical protein
VLKARGSRGIFVPPVTLEEQFQFLLDDYAIASFVAERKQLSTRRRKAVSSKRERL